MSKRARQEVVIVGNAPRMRVDRIRPNLMNDNRQSDFMFGKLKASILADGFVDPLVVRTGDESGPFEDGAAEIIGGEHRWRAAQALGMEEVPVHDLGNLSDLRARKILLTLNRIRGESDQDALSRILREIHDEGGQDALETVPFDQDMLLDLLDGEAAATLPPIHDLAADGLAAGDGEVVDKTAAPSARDLLVLLGAQSLRNRELDSLLEAVRAWVFSRKDTDKPAWLDLVTLVRSATLPPT